jgi:sterol desaturase/sphingolipid hydroxylase (fatty acid hydroxylase superfamily)
VPISLWSVVPVAVLLALAALERVWPLRRRVEPGLRRLARNVGLWAISAAVLAVVDRPITAALARRVEDQGLGLLPHLGLPRVFEMAAGLVVLDYVIFLWHILLHRVPLLWRFHEVHHSDRDLDVTTALRFHAGEMVFSVVWRAALVVAVGIRPPTLAVWHSVLFLSVLFHHSNLRLPAAVERGLGLLTMTPRLHGIHHSVVSAEMNSNYSSGLTLWDRLHHTLRADVAQESITIGVAEVPREEGRFGRLVTRPFRA